MSKGLKHFAKGHMQTDFWHRDYWLGVAVTALFTPHRVITLYVEPGYYLDWSPLPLLPSNFRYFYPGHSAWPSLRGHVQWALAMVRAPLGMKRRVLSSVAVGHVTRTAGIPAYCVLA